MSSAAVARYGMKEDEDDGGGSDRGDGSGNSKVGKCLPLHRDAKLIAGKGELRNQGGKKERIVFFFFLF